MKRCAIRWFATVGVMLAAVVQIVAAESAADPQQQIATLRREIARHDVAYHRQAAPEISDYDYDQLKRRLTAIEREFPDSAKAVPPLPEVGDDRSGLFQTARHRERMLSLEKAHSEADLRAFHARVVKLLGRAALAYVVEPKFDGLAVSVTYENGKLVRAVTRGNGTEGDDITAHVRLISGVPRELRGGGWPGSMEVRGELYMSFAEFARVNAEREAAGEALFANPRNLAAGALRQLDPQEVVRRGLSVVFYAVGACEPLTALPATQRELTARFIAWGLPSIEQAWAAQGADALVRAVETCRGARSRFGFPTDGAVVKLDSLSLQREAGAGEHAPRWAVAYKFAPERAETQLLAITVQVGRTGVLTPVAELAPVQLAGSTIARASLHNRAEIARKGIRIGDTVTIEKAGEIIPAVVGVNLERRPAISQPYVFPTACPECRAAVVERTGEVAVRCPNGGCPAQLRRRIEHFASKACVDISGLGPTMIETLVAKGWVKSLPDVYQLKRDELLTLGRNNAKSVDRLLAAIEHSRRAELWRVIYGLGLPGVGAVAAKELARNYRTLEGLAAAHPTQRSLIADLVAAGLQPTPPPSTGTRFAGKTFVLTGTLPTFTRAQATARIEAAGGKVATSVSRTTHYVVAGSEAGVKLEQAKTLGVAILDESALVRMLGED